MMDKRPDDYSDAEAWYKHFRFSKAISGFEYKLNAERERTPDAAAARVVMTAYVAAVLNVAIAHMNFGLGKESLVAEMDQIFGLKPYDLIDLSVPQIAGLSGFPFVAVASSLKSAGFTIGDDGAISGFNDPKPAISAVKPRVPAPKPPK